MIVRVVVRSRWWVRPYVTLVYAIATALHREPDEAKISKVIRRGLIVQLVPADRLVA